MKKQADNKKKSGKGLYDLTFTRFFILPDIHVRQDRHGYFSCISSGSIAFRTNVGSKKVSIIFIFSKVYR